MKTYEKLGSFYLGKAYDLATREMGSELTLYDSKDLLTHAVCVGMTGSGKTGLCVSLLEEAAIDGVPSIVIDPKGDLTNLLLTFPQLRPKDFRPWINEDEAAQKNLTPDEFAKQTAELWRNGLASWDEDGERIQRLRDAADFSIYTPGSDAGLPVSILSSFNAPPAEIQEDNELRLDRISNTATSLLGILGIDADPIQSREHILISTILDRAWNAGENVDLGGLIQQIQSPPFSRVGVLELEAFYPQKDRFGLAMRLNNLIAAPGFQSWLEGTPLDIDKMLYTAEGKPRVSIFCIAHLSDAERMFFVSLLLNQTLGWMRTRSGTTSLRALLYMDEIFGYMPPVSNPPSKKPLLTMLKQARAFGVGVVLATQNPVDLDFKGLSNTGTWLIGRLQTERDKMRVLDGLEGAAVGSEGFDRGKMEQVLAGLGKRVFLMHNVHESTPTVFHTRWAMSYLRGPMTRDHIKKLMKGRKKQEAAIVADDGVATPADRAPAAPKKAKQATSGAPVLAPGVEQRFVAPATDGDLLYLPSVAAFTDVTMVQTRRGLQDNRRRVMLHPADRTARRISWKDAETAELSVDALQDQPGEGVAFDELWAAAGKKTSYTTWKKSLVDYLYRNERSYAFEAKKYKLTSDVGENERDFRIRLKERVREERDAAKEKLRKKFAGKEKTLRERLRKAEQAVEREKDQARSRKLQTAISVGATILGAVLGRGRVSSGTVGRASTAARGAERSVKESRDVDRAQENVAAIQKDIDALVASLESEIDAIESELHVDNVDITTVELKPRKTDIAVEWFGLVWLPYQRSGRNWKPGW